MESDFKSEDVCRVCLSSGNEEEMQQLFVNGSDIVEQIEYCTGLLLQPAPSLPTLICQPCLSQLRTAHSFKTTCFNSHHYLHSVTFTEKPKRLSNTCDPAPTSPVTVKVEAVDQDDFGDDIGGDEEMGDEWVDQVRKSRRIKLKKEKEDRADAPLRAPKRGPYKKTRRALLARLACAACDVRFASAAECEAHRAAAHPVEEPEPRPSELQTPFAARPVSCGACGEQFASAVERAAHRARRHARPKARTNEPWICEICGKMFTHRSSHYTHVRSHLPPLHACPQCEYRTWHRHDLNKHMRIHTGEKNFQCAACPMSFYNSSNLLSHMRRTHERARPHACAQCPRRFYDRTKLRRHIDSHDDIKRFECEVCHSCFTRRCYWKKHLQKQHGIVIPPAKSGRQKLNFLVGEDLIKPNKDWPALVQGSGKGPSMEPSARDRDSSPQAHKNKEDIS